MLTFLYQQGKHIKDNELYNSEKTCPICLSGKKRNKILNIQKNPSVDLLYCSYCGGYSTSSMPSADLLKKYYENYYQDRKNPDKKITFQNSRRFAIHLARKIILNKNIREVSILDFGGGDGSLAKATAEELGKKNKNISFKITVSDLFNLKNYDSGRIKIRYLNNLNKIQTKFDIIIAGAVFEHIPQLNKTLNVLFRLMRNNGYFYARTSFINPLIKYFPWVDFTFPYHVHDLGALFWRKAIDTFNLKGYKLILSQPSVVETDFRADFFITLLSHILKLPAFFEAKIPSRKKNNLIWGFYGGWEVILKKDEI